MIGVILNPHAHAVKRRPGMRERLAAILGSRGEVVETRSPEDLTHALDRLMGSGAQVIATCGGDGTNLSTITELVRKFGATRLPAFALLRGGTVNTVAENLAIRGQPEELLARLIARREAGELSLRGQDLLHVSGRYGFLFAAAMGARFLEAYYERREPGPGWAALLAARTIASSLVYGPFARRLFSEVPAELEVDGRPERAVSHPRLLLASTVPDVGIGMRVTWQAGRQPGRFHLIASHLSTAKMALQLPRVLAGRPLAGSPHLDVLARSAHLRFPSPEPFTLDGELYRAREISIEIGPRLSIARL